jgi:hypothetical protein
MDGPMSVLLQHALSNKQDCEEQDNVWEPAVLFTELSTLIHDFSKRNVHKPVVEGSALERTRTKRKDLAIR